MLQEQNDFTNLGGTHEYFTLCTIVYGKSVDVVEKKYCGATAVPYHKLFPCEGYSYT